MKWMRAGSALMVAAVMAAGAFAQTNEDLQRQLNELKSSMQSQIDRLEAENATLKVAAAPTDAGLETEINRLSERMAAGTNIRSGASGVKLGGEFRYRGYFMSGDVDENDTQTPIPGADGKGDFERNGWYGDSRVRLNFQYDFGCDVTAFAELQAHWGWGEDYDGLPDEYNGTDVEGDVGMYQAWLEIRNILCRSELSARIGRQEIVLGNQFQFGNADWFNGISFDALRVDWRANCWSLTGIAAKLTTDDGDYNQSPAYFDDHDDSELYSLYFTLRSIRNHVLDLYWIYVNGHGGQPGDSGASVGWDDGNLFNDGFFGTWNTAYFHTLGARIGGTIGIGCGLDWNVEGAIQSGTAKFFGTESDVEGATLEGEVGLTLSKSNKFRVYARGLWAEGPDDDNTGYLTLFPNRHSNGSFRARYGLMDIIPMEDVMSLQAGVHFDPACNWTLGATLLWASAESDYNFGSDDDYGTEIDIWAEYRYSQNLTFGAGLGFFFVDEDTFGPDVDDIVLGYLQARLVF